MRKAQTIRITLLLAAIFASGVFTGRWIAPRPPAPIVIADTPPRTSGEALARLSRQVNLDAQQRERLRPVLEEIGEKMAAFPPASKARLELFQRFVPQMRAALRPDQYEAFDRYVELSTRRFQRGIRKDTAR